MIRRNLVLATTASGLCVWRVFKRDPPRPVATGNVLLNNTRSRGTGDGIVVEGLMCEGFACAEAPVGTLLRHNRTRYNAADGIRVDAPSTTVVRNVARFTGGLRIQAVSGVTDGGRNRAVGNGDPAQCAGVVCAP